MRREWFIPVLLVIPSPAMADDMIPESQFVPPAYKILRFDEDHHGWVHAAHQLLAGIEAARDRYAGFFGSGCDCFAF